MPLHLDREWTLPLVQFVKNIDQDPLLIARSRSAAMDRAVRRLAYSADKKRFSLVVNGQAIGEQWQGGLALAGGLLAPQCDCCEAPPCAHALAGALVILGEAYRRGSAYRAEIRPLLPHPWRISGILYDPPAAPAAAAMFEFRRPPAAASPPPGAEPQNPSIPPSPASSGEPRRRVPAAAKKSAPTPPPAASPGAKGKPLDAPPLQLVWKLVPGGGHGLPCLAWQLHLRNPGAPVRLCTARDIKKLKHELASRSGAPWQQSRRLVSWLLDNAPLDPPASLPTAERHGTYALIHAQRWLAAWGGTPLLRWEGGEPVRDGQAAATPAITAGEQGQAVWALALPPDPHGFPPLQPLAAATVFADTEDGWRWDKVFACRRGVVFPVALDGLAPAELAAMRAAGDARCGVFGDPLRELRLIRKIAADSARRSGPSERQNSWFAELPVRPVIELRHKRASWITVAVYARARSGEVFLRSEPGLWEHVADPALAARWRTESPFAHAAELSPLSEPGEPVSADSAPPADPSIPSPPAEPLLILPRTADLEAADAWLARLIPRTVMPVPHGDNRFVYEWPSTDWALADVARHWADRPAGVDYFGNPEFVRLVDLRRRPALRVSIEQGGVDWLWVAAELEGELARLTAAEVRALLSATREALVRLPDGRSYQREGLEELHGELLALERLGIRVGEPRRPLHALQLAGEAGAAAALSSLLPDASPFAALDASLRRLAAEFAGIPPAAVAAETAPHLRPYQRAGTDFLAWAGRHFGGALLADDMGLGKTLQLLAALTALRSETDGPGPALVVCPASVARNWQREARRFCPALRTLVLEAGAGRQSQLAGAAAYDLVIANYALVRRDAALLRQVPWLLVCVDEAQAIKNPLSETAAVVKSLPARYRYALTGTPVENRLADLVSIVEFAAPAALGAVSDSELRDPAAQPALTRLLRTRLRPVLLRRLKREVAPELPERIEERIDCVMEEAQRRLYLAQVARARGLLGGLAGGRLGGRERMHIFAALTRLRQLCCEPALLGHAEAGSAKLDALLELLPVLLEEGHKVLVFSQFVAMLEILEQRLKRESIPHRLLTGETPPARRQELVDAFERDPTPGIFLISLKAGGAGLNLVSASHVILFDPWWNPAVEAQAIDRTHRIGQDKTVVAFRLVTLGTIEERILELQERKRELTRSVLDAETFGQALSREDLEFLFAEPG